MKHLATFYISPTGNDRWSGRSAEHEGQSREGPWGTLEGARNRLRTLRRRGELNCAVRVLIAPGVYRLDRPLVFGPEDGGTASAPVTWRGHGGRPVISGGHVITGWEKGTINGHACWQVVLPEVKAGRWWFTQLFVNGRRRLRARLPKQGFYRFTGVPEEEAKVDTGAFFHAAMSACFATGEVRNFRNPDDIDVVVPDHWYENHLRIASVDEQSGVIHFATKGHSRFSKDETGRHTRFRLDHVAEGCNEPGDWYLDRSTGTLAYIPLPGENPGETVVEAPVLERLLDIRGDALDSGKRVHHLRFEFLDLRHTEWELPRDNPGAIQSSFNVPAAVRFVGAGHCALYACLVSHVAGWGVELLRGCHGNRLVACAIFDLGGGGVKVGPEDGLQSIWVTGSHAAFNGMNADELGWGPCREEGVETLPGRGAVLPSATTVSDCSIHDGGIIFHSAIGVWVGDASHNRIIHNRIFNFNYSGISCGWNWGYMPAATCDNHIEANHISGIGHGMLSDMGAIYTLGRQAGSTVRRNVIHDVSSYGYGGWGIYPDEGTCWMLVEENIVCDTKCGGFHQHYGRDNLVRRNVFACAAEDQVAITRQEMVRPLTFERNLVQGAGNGALWSGLWSGGWDKLICRRNLYAPETGRSARFCKQTWEAWQEGGNDTSGRIVDAMILDTQGNLPVPANPEIPRLMGLSREHFARIRSEAGPRLGGVLPGSIDDISQEPQHNRPIVESCLWPWPAQWPGEHEWNNLPKAATARRGEPCTVSLTLENRGDASVSGRYRLRVSPANAARIIGPRELNVALKPGARTALETTVVATGKTKTFRIEAVAAGDGLLDSCLYWDLTEDAIMSHE